MDHHRHAPQPPPFRDRVDAGEQLAARLEPAVRDVPPEDLVVVGLARGGVVVAAEVARTLGARLEAIFVRKLGAPNQPELAIGAITAGGRRVLNRALIADLGLSERDLERITARAHDAALALAREIGVPAALPDLAGMTVILVDDGLATGATMRVAIDAASGHAAARVLVAVPVTPTSMVEPFRTVADDLVAVVATQHLSAVGRWYEVFEDVPSATVRMLLQAARDAREV